METSENTQLYGQPNPSLISSTGKFGVKGVKYFLMVVFLLGFVNTIFLIISIFSFSAVEPMSKYLLCIFLIVILGILFTIGALYFTYKYLLIDGISVLYKHAAPFFRKLSTLIIDKVEHIAIDKMHISDAHIDKAFNVGNILAETYGQKTPRFAQKGISFIINRIPFTNLILNIKDSIKDRDKEKASSILYNEIDNYIRISILGGNSMKFMYWILPLNILFQIILIIVLKSFI